MTFFSRIALLVPLSLALGWVASSVPAAAGNLRVSKSDCDKLVAYRQPPGVEHQPGVDVNGRPVVPADLNGGTQIRLPDTILVPITVDLGDRFGIPHNSVLFDATAFIGIASVRLSDGKVTFNGQDLSDPETRALAAACQRAGAGG